ncbi:MAG: ORF6N domain-containing protein [Chitinophagaceae bacterium]
MSIVSEEMISSKVYLIRGRKVMLDMDLANLYQVENKRLKEAIRRNIDRFPEDFMFVMSASELENWRTQFASSNSLKGGLRYPPFCFTEQGVAMLSSVLNSETAIRVNIQIIRVFTKMRELLFSNKDILLQLQKIESNLQGHDLHIAVIFEHLKKLIHPSQPPRRKIGFKRKGEPEPEN